MPPNLFSTYRQGENRITSTLLAVLQQLSLLNIDRILGSLLGDASFSLASFDNQPRASKSIPDARIVTANTVWVETKTERNSASDRQIKNHLEVVGEGEKLLLLTPDNSAPEGLDTKVAWANFNTLADTIGEILEDDDDPPSEKDAFLLRALLSMIREDGLLSTDEPIVAVVAASHAWPMYKKIPAYRCGLRLPLRSDDQFTHVAFYRYGQIMPIVPKVKGLFESINFTQPEEIARLTSRQRPLAEELLKRMKATESEDFFGGRFHVLYLSSTDDDETIHLENPIHNDKKDRNGRLTAFTQSKHRYVTLYSLKKANKTSDLDII